MQRRRRASGTGQKTYHLNKGRLQAHREHHRKTRSETLGRYGAWMGSHWSTSDIGPMAGKVAMVTGANSGLGFCIADALARAGAEVLLACRSRSKAEAAATRLRATASGSVEVLEMDLADLASVRGAAEAFTSSNRPLHLLINNAGLMAIDESRTVDGFETQFGVNHLGHFALTAALLPVLNATPNARVVTMSSMGHRMGSMHFDDIMFDRKYDRWGAYFQSKLANLLFTQELHARLQRAGSATAALTAHPGGSRTDLGHEGKGASNKVIASVAPAFMQSAARGAQPALRAATDPAATSGQFYGPRFMTAGWAVLEKPSRAARDATAAARLWDLSESLISRSVLAK